MAEALPRGWHREDIKAAIRKRGSNLNKISREVDFDLAACREALMRPRYRAEQAIAAFLGVAPVELWPERYDADGTSRHPRARCQHRTAPSRVRPCQKRRAA